MVLQEDPEEHGEEQAYMTHRRNAHAVGRGEAVWWREESCSTHSFSHDRMFS